LAAGEGVLLGEVKDWGALFLSELGARPSVILHFNKLVIEVLFFIMVGSGFFSVKGYYILLAVVRLIKQIHGIRKFGVFLIETECISHCCE